MRTLPPALSSQMWARVGSDGTMGRRLGLENSHLEERDEAERLGEKQWGDSFHFGCAEC